MTRKYFEDESTLYNSVVPLQSEFPIFRDHFSANN